MWWCRIGRLVVMNEDGEQDFERKMIRVKTLKPEIIITENFSINGKYRQAYHLGA